VSLARRLPAEGLGTAYLLAAVVGSRIMGERLAGAWALAHLMFGEPLFEAVTVRWLLPGASARQVSLVAASARKLP
jgi:hypothetical protein